MTGGATARPTLTRLTLAGYPVVLPDRRDPRLRLSAVIVSLQVLGQTVLGFKVSIAQILVSIGVCLAVDFAVVFWRTRSLVWPASAMLTGNSIGFILRAWGTRHGDWWSLNGIQYFVLAAVLAMLSKHLLRLGGKHVYNPSNLALVVVLLVIGAPFVYPQYLWWGPLSAPVELALAVIAAGALLVLRPVRMVPMAIAFMAPFTALMAAFALSGRCFVAIWSASPICGSSYFLNLSLSPELLVFVFFMMSDPRTAPAGQRGRIAYGAATALLAAALIYPQPTEYGVKVALLAALALVCSAIPLARWVNGRRRPQGERELPVPLTVRPAAIAVALVMVLVPIGVVSLAQDAAIFTIESGGARPGAPGSQ